MAPQREWFEKDYYKVLGVSEGASQKDITKAYRKLAHEYHPDINQAPEAEERFKEVSAAYDVVGDAEKRKEYDEVRRLGPMAGGFGGPGPGGFGGFGGPGGATFTAEDLGDMGNLGDLLGGLFGRGGRRGGAPRGAGPQRGDDLEAELHLSFEDAVRGVTTAVNLTSDAPCHTCHGSGAAPGSTPVTCSRCGGRGVLDENQGLFSFSQACPQCAGRGVVVEALARGWRGGGVDGGAGDAKIGVPAGVNDRQRIRLKGRGGPGRNGGPAGDLFVVVRVRPHDYFGRSGRDLTLTVPVTYAEAALGADVAVPTLDGESVKIRLPAGTRNGRTFRVKGRGVATKKGTGDLLATVEVAVPQKLSAAERKAVEALAAASTESPRAHLGV